MEPETGPNFFENFDFQAFLLTNRKIVVLILLGLILVGLGAFLVKSGASEPSTKIEVLSEATEAQIKDLIVEVSGAVEKPGVYNLSDGSRVEDALILAGGLSLSADREWVEKTLNRAAKIIDGQKIYIPKEGEKVVKNGGDGATKNFDLITQNSLVNINTASLADLDKLPGIGPVYGQSIIDHRPYSSVEELLSKGALKKNVYDKIKDKVSIY